MASAIAKKIWALEWSDGPHQVDAELAEVREVLDTLKQSRHGCWCHPDLESSIHTDECDRARALYARLQPQGKES